MANRQSTLQIRLLGRFELRTGDTLLLDGAWPHGKAKAILKLLALQPEHRIHRERLFEALWPDKPPRSSASNVRKNLHMLRSALRAAGVDHPVVATQAGPVTLAPGVSVDVDEFRAKATAALDSGDDEQHGAALSCYTGQLLPEDIYEEWAAPVRAEVRDLRNRLLSGLVAIYSGRGDSAAAERCLRRVAREDPLDEEAQRSLIRLLAESGRRDRALLQYREYRDALERELDAAPSEETEQLHRRVQEGEIGPMRTNLPARATAFVGRTDEMEAVRALLERHRLVTLVGVGGIGKTSLGLEVGRSVLPAYVDGVWLVSLGDVRDPELVPETVARVFSLREEPGQPLAEMLCRYLRVKRALLVLDDCEQIVPAVAHAATTIVQACPDVRILVTSRERLRIREEQVFEVPPLPAPDPAHLSVDRRDLARYESIELFLDRARMAAPQHGATVLPIRAVAGICATLDGLPLAIELAASSVRTMSVDDIARRIAQSLDGLGPAPRASLSRHQTLQASLDWSHDMLTDAERWVFARLAVFAGGFRLAAAEAVCETVAGESVLPLLTLLADRSLIVVSGDGRDERRFHLLQPVRQYAWQHLERSSEFEAVRAAHAGYYLCLAEAENAAIIGREQARALDRLAAEHDNLRAALRWSLDSGRSDEALRFGAALARFWFVRGHVSEGMRWLTEALAQGEGASKPVRANALWGASGLASLGLGDGERAEAWAGESVRCYRELDDVHGIAFVRGQEGMTFLFQGKFEQAAEAAEESLALCDSPELAWTAAIDEGILAQAALARGDVDAARELLSRSTAPLLELGDLEGAAILIVYAANLACRSRVGGWAADLAAEGLALFGEIGDRRGAGWALDVLGLAAASEGASERAAEALAAAEALRESIASSMRIVDPEQCEQALAAARERLGPRAFAEASRRGAESTLDGALAHFAAAPAAALS